MVYNKALWSDGVEPPPGATTLFNRCNLPAQVLASLAYQEHPVPLEIANVVPMHHDLWDALEPMAEPEQRVQKFMDYMVVRFCLHQPEEAGYTEGRRLQRKNMDYLRILRGWLFDADSREGAVFKGWVASRFGLTPRWHGGPLTDLNGEHYARFQAMQSVGIYNTNALEYQLDLLFTFCQYELRRRSPETKHLRLYRGVNRMENHELLRQIDKRRWIVWLNNLNSFTTQREQAGEFGDYMVEIITPLTKIVCFNQLLPSYLKGENEYLVLGGAYRVAVSWA